MTQATESGGWAAVDWSERARALGADGACSLRTQDVRTAAWVELKCRYGCPTYGTRLTCPPHGPDVDAFRAVLAEFTHALLVWVEVPGGGDEEELKQRRRLHAAVLGLERELFLAGAYRAFGLAQGPCFLCDDDPCPLEGPCRHASRARPSMQACGIDTFATVRAAGLRIGVVVAADADYRLYGLLLLA